MNKSDQQKIANKIERGVKLTEDESEAVINGEVSMVRHVVCVEEDEVKPNGYRTGHCIFKLEGESQLYCSTYEKDERKNRGYHTTSPVVSVSDPTQGHTTTLDDSFGGLIKLLRKISGDMLSELCPDSLEDLFKESLKNVSELSEEKRIALARIINQ